MALRPSVPVHPVLSITTARKAARFRGLGRALKILGARQADLRFEEPSLERNRSAQGHQIIQTIRPVIMGEIRDLMAAFGVQHDLREFIGLKGESNGVVLCESDGYPTKILAGVFPVRRIFRCRTCQPRTRTRLRGRLLLHEQELAL